MKYSYSWIQEHLAKPLPKADELARTITLKAFEVEGAEQSGNDTILDIKVLPDRAHDALSHRGMACEISALCDIPMSKSNPRATLENSVLKGLPLDSSVSPVRVSIEDSKRCMRYIGVRVDGVSNSPTPELAAKLASIGANSRGTIVDITNFVLFDIGQPMHAFDAAKVVGGITVRAAKAGEEMATLDGKQLKLDGSETVIADDEGVLALAGVKGGKKAEVDTNTTSIIFESANFDPTITRRTAQKHGIHTDASKRFENGITSTLAEEAMRQALELVSNYIPSAKVGAITDIYPVKEDAPRGTEVSLSQLNGLLGTTISEDDVTVVLKRLAHAGFAYEANGGAYKVTPPSTRLDINIPEDLIEEIGRHYGYDKITPVVPVPQKRGLPNKRLYYANKVRKFLIERGFSEVYTYSFSPDKGDGVEVLNPVGDDRPFMRDEIAKTTGLRAALMTNSQNAPVFGETSIHIYEFGNVFTVKGEQFHVALGSDRKKAGLKASLLDAIIAFGINIKEIKEVIPDGSAPYDMYELDFDATIASLPEPTSYEPLFSGDKGIVYKPFSRFPHILRDIALFVPTNVPEGDIERMIRDNAGELLVRFSRFDKFQKSGEDRISYAFRLVFQSYDRTLTDDEINSIMDAITAKLNANSGWLVR
jgi:phenylalanyl-tRNA synthetase beta chain